MTAYAPPGARSPLRRRHRRPHASPTTRSTRLIDDFVARRDAWPSTPASTSSTSSTATAISATSCSAPSTPRAVRRLVREPHRFLRDIVDGIRADAPGLGIGVRALAPSTPCPIRKDADGVGDAGSPDMASLPPRLRPAAPIRRLEPSTSSRAARASCDAARDAGHRLGLRHGRQPVLQPAHPAAGAVPAVRRLPAAGGSAGRRAPGRSTRSRALKRDVPEPRHRRLRLHLPAGVAAARRPGRGPRGPHRLRRPRPHGAVLSGPARRRPRRQAARRASRSAAPSATAPAARATASSPAASRSIRSTRRIPTRRGSKAHQGRRAAHERRTHRADRLCAAVTAFVVALLDRRPRALRPAVLLRLHGPGLRLDAAPGHVGQRLQQADRRPAVRLPRRLVRRSLRPAPADARRHPDGRPRARSGSAIGDVAWRCSTSSTCSTRSATSAAGRCPTRCCSRAGSTRPRQGHGLRLPRHRHRRRARAAPRRTP